MEVRSKENRESSTAKRDFHPFFSPLPFFPLLFLFFFLPFLSTLCETRSNRPFEHTTGFTATIPFPPEGGGGGGGKKEEGRRKIVNTAIKREERKRREGRVKRRKRGWKIARKEEMRGKAKDENLEGSELKGISGDTWILSPPPPFFPARNFPVEILRNNRGGSGIFFYRSEGGRSRKKSKWGEGKRDGGIRRKGKFEKEVWVGQIFERV